MGADLYESYCGSILATAALGAAAFIHSADTVMQFKAVIAPMLIAAVGIIPVSYTHLDVYKRQAGIVSCFISVRVVFFF